MKDGSTHLAHKAEHAVDLASGAVVAITLQAADLGDTTTVHATLKEAQANAELINERGVEEAVLDKGYHSGEVILIFIELASAAAFRSRTEPWNAGTVRAEKKGRGDRRRCQDFEQGKAIEGCGQNMSSAIPAYYETGIGESITRAGAFSSGSIPQSLFNVALLVQTLHGIQLAGPQGLSAQFRCSFRSPNFTRWYQHHLHLSFWISDRNILNIGINLLTADAQRKKSKSLLSPQTSGR